MKKKFLVLAVALVSAMLCGFFAGCSEMGPGRGHATVATIGYDGNVCEVEIVVDGYGGVAYVAFDEIFNVYYASQVKDKAAFDALPDGGGFTVSGARSDTYHYTLISVGDKFFTGHADGRQAVYDEIDSGTGELKSGGITDLNTYMGKKENVEWYYNAYKSSALKTYIPDAAGAVEIGEGTYKANNMLPTYGSMRKSKSTYWNTPSSPSGLAWRGNMQALEAFVMANGFEGLEFLENFDSDDAEVIAGIIEKFERNEESGYVTINDKPSGATLVSDTYMYLGTAYRAYRAAMDDMMS